MTITLNKLKTEALCVIYSVVSVIALFAITYGLDMLLAGFKSSANNFWLQDFAYAFCTEIRKSAGLIFIIGVEMLTLTLLNLRTATGKVWITTLSRPCIYM